ncbi:MAG: cation:proton antiporter [Ilumatobacter sp.]|uniref:cation:proton antiporter domain-containing protein n=3 Tax=Ilumatobacter sp. TaxID=1967498 RepID=UPI003296D100
MIWSTVLAAGEGVDEHVISRVFLAIAIVIGVARLAGAVAKLVRQPPVVGEIIGGILLGPTLLGLFPGDLDELFFPTDIRPFLTVIANLGLIIFMFIVGLELDGTLIKGKERIAGVISISSIALPMALGSLLAIYLHRSHGVVDGEDVKILPFALFIGAAMSVTAFPVLARIMIDRGMYRTQIGALTLASAAVDDVLAWALLAVVLAVVESGTFLTWEFPQIIGFSILFAVVMIAVVRPLLARLVPAYQRAGRLTPNLAAIVIGGFLLASFVTSGIGIHHILGAFTFGAMMPRRDAHALNLEILERLEQVTVILLLPVFFVTTGLVVDIGALRASDLGVLALILLTACAGKFIGATVAARSQGVRPWRKAAAIGSLMNTRGLTELIILSIGREAGVLDDRLFTMLVVMAVLTTVLTEPALRLFYPDRMLARDVAEAQKLSLGLEDAFRVFVAVDDPADAARAVQMGCEIVGDERPSEIVLSRLVELGRTPELGGTSARLADITASMDAMAVLEQQVTDSGIGARVLTRFSSEPTRDLLGQAEANDIDLVLLGAGDSLDPGAAADELDRTVVVHGVPDEDASANRTVTLLAGESDDAIAAFAIAVRIARSRNVSLRIEVDGSRSRRWEAAAQRLGEIGVDAAVEGAALPDTGSGGLVAPRGLVVAAGDRPTGPIPGAAETLHVFAPPDMGRTIDDVLAEFGGRSESASDTVSDDTSEKPGELRPLDA